MTAWVSRQRPFLATETCARALSQWPFGDRFVAQVVVLLLSRVSCALMHCFRHADCFGHYVPCPTPVF